MKRPSAGDTVLVGSWEALVLAAEVPEAGHRTGDLLKVLLSMNVPHRDAVSGSRNGTNLVIFPRDLAPFGSRRWMFGWDIAEDPPELPKITVELTDRAEMPTQMGVRPITDELEPA